MSSEGRYRQRLSAFAANWRALALRGLAALIFGLVIHFWQGLVFAVLALIFGIYALVDGGIVLVPALRTSDRGARRWLPLAEGTVGVVAVFVFAFRTRDRQRHRQAQPSGTRTARYYSPLHPSQIEPKAPFRGIRLR
jgi:uncharacterized membrane protein HdeD (DUF308 family)